MLKLRQTRRQLSSQQSYLVSTTSTLRTWTGLGIGWELSSTFVIRSGYTAMLGGTDCNGLHFNPLSMLYGEEYGGVATTGKHG